MIHSKIISCIILFITLAHAIDFAVVAPGATTAKVSIAGSVYNLSPKYAEVPYFVGTIAGGNTGSITYKYIINDVAESFDRTFPAVPRTKTYNDFYGRQDTLKQMANLGWPFSGETQQWSRNLGPNGVFDDDYISTVIFAGGAEVDFFFRNITKKTKVTNMKVAMINKDDVIFATDVEVNVEDTSQLRPNMKLEFSKNYKSRSDYKLRPSAADPVFIRDKLYNDILQAIGCPHQESSFTRVYVNGNGLGLYNLQEKPASKDFIKTQFYGRNREKPEILGTPLDAKTGADFAVDSNIFAFEPPKDGNNTKVGYLMSALAALDTSSDAAMATFEKNWFSIEYFLRAIAVEYLAAHYDSYWFMTTNFVVYDDPTEGIAGTYKFYFIDQDFDQTFGLNLAPIYNPYGENYTRIPYSEYVNKNWSVVPYDAPRRTMIDRLFSNPSTKARFEEILKTIVRGVFNPIALNRRIDALIARITPDMQWDLNLGETRAHQQWNLEAIVYTLDDFNNGMTTSIRGNWPLKTYIAERANAVAEQFGIQFIDPPLEPGTPQTSGNNAATTGNGSNTGNTGNTGNTVTTSSAQGSGNQGSSTNSGSQQSTGATGQTTDDQAANSASKQITGILSIILIIAMYL